MEENLESGLLCQISGRVQGVFFRASTRDQALRLGLRGHARNLSDGRVEVLAWGQPAALAQLRAWLEMGPPGARVTALSCVPVTDPPGPGFLVR